MDGEVALALGQLLGESQQVVVVVDEVAAVDLRAEGVDAVLALRTDGGGREEFMIRQLQSNAIGSGGPRHTGPHGIDDGAHLSQALHFALSLHHSISMPGKH